VFGTQHMHGIKKYLQALAWLSEGNQVCALSSLLEIAVPIICLFYISETKFLGCRYDCEVLAEFIFPQINGLYRLETLWKCKIIAPQVAWMSFYSTTSVHHHPVIPYPSLSPSPSLHATHNSTKIANFKIITNQLHTLIRQYTLFLLLNSKYNVKQ